MVTALCGALEQRNSVYCRVGISQTYAQQVLPQASYHLTRDDRGCRRTMCTTSGKVRTTSSEEETVGRRGVSAVVVGGNVRNLVSISAAVVAWAGAVDAGGGVCTGVGAQRARRNRHGVGGCGGAQRAQGKETLSAGG